MEPVNQEDVEWIEREKEEYAVRRQRLAAAAGGEELGCSRYVLPPGNRAWPYHYHTGNEEALYVLSGSGSLRVGDDAESTAHPLTGGDYVAFPAGPDSAHRVENTGERPLRFLVMSTMNDPDVTVYPDSGKIGVYAGSPPGGRAERSVEGYYRRDDAVSYWEGE